MARPKPKEELIPVTYRLTRKQINKVKDRGGVTWLRKHINAARKPKENVDART